MLSNEAAALKADITAHVLKVLAFERASEGDQTPLAQALTLVGRHLTGRKMGVRLRRSIYPGDIWGTAYNLPGNRAVIDVDPDRSLAIIFETFLHETAHIKLHYFDVEDNPYFAMEPGTYKVAPPSRNTDFSTEARSAALRNEAEADAQAARWDDFASDPDRLRSVGYDWSDPDYPIEIHKLHALSRLKVYKNGVET